jgi:hypothetical protein
MSKPSRERELYERVTRRFSEHILITIRFEDEYSREILCNVVSFMNRTRNKRVAVTVTKDSFVMNVVGVK